MLADAVHTHEHPFRRSRAAPRLGGQLLAPPGGPRLGAGFQGQDGIQQLHVGLDQALLYRGHRAAGRNRAWRNRSWQPRHNWSDDRWCQATTAAKDWSAQGFALMNRHLLVSGFQGSSHGFDQAFAVQIGMGLKCLAEVISEGPAKGAIDVGVRRGLGLLAGHQIQVEIRSAAKLGWFQSS